MGSASDPVKAPDVATNVVEEIDVAEDEATSGSNDVNIMVDARSFPAFSLRVIGELSREKKNVVKKSTRLYTVFQRSEL